jgi:hypothetical protein
MVKSKKLILIGLLGLIVTACGTSRTTTNEEAVNSHFKNRQIDLIQKRIGRFNQ